MKQLHFQRAGSDIQVAYEGNYRFVVHTVREMPELYKAAVFHRDEGNTKPINTKVVDSRAEAIDWLAKQRETVA
jgi:hypothetical protein